MPRVARGTFFVLLSIHALLLAYSAYVHSPTLNEPGHLVAGLSNWGFGQFELYRTNPPLVRMAAALPVIAAGYDEDWSGYFEGSGTRPELSMGQDFVLVNGERSFILFMIARWACIPFSLVGATVCYLWARDLYGQAAGVLACAIWCFEPNILGHASLITPDAHATALGLAACYTFWRWLKRPTWMQAALTGVVLGLAELAKTTLILFYPLWPLMWIAYRWPDRWQMSRRDWLREAGMLGLRMLIGLYVLNLGYGFEGSLTQMRDFHFVSDTFTGQQRNVRASAPPPLDNPASDGGHSQPADATKNENNRFAGSWLGELRVPLPRNYLLGIDLQRKDFERYPRQSYLRGELGDSGWWYYYLYAVVIKVPLGLWCLGIYVLVTRLNNRILKSGKSYDESASEVLPSLRDKAILLFPGVAIFAFVSFQTGFSEHMRYVLPAFPFFFIWISQAASFFHSGRLAIECAVSEPSRTGWLKRPLFSPFVVAGLVAWFFASSLWIYPHSLAYFNEFVGGPLHGPNHLLGSSVDWCQDLRYLKWWTDKHPKIDELHLAYHCLHDPAVANFGPVKILAIDPEESVHPNTNDDGAVSTAVAALAKLPPGIYAVSINVLYDQWSARSVGGHSSQLSKEVTRALREREPYDWAGYSILIFRK